MNRVNTVHKKEAEKVEKKVEAPAVSKPLMPSTPPSPAKPVAPEAPEFPKKMTKGDSVKFAGNQEVVNILTAEGWA